MEEMTTIQACDIPDIVSAEAKPGIMDEEILAEALNRLNGLVGLQHAKKALTDYVAISRLRHTKGTLRIGQETLCWDFIGKTGTGKSSVAEILGKIQQGLGILKRNHTVCVSIDGKSWNGTYTFDEKTHAIQLKGLLLSASGFATRTANGISLLFEQKKLLTLVKTLSKLNLTGSTTMSAVSSIVDNYDGVRIGFEMTK